jgi:hypothetical protein
MQLRTIDDIVANFKFFKLLLHCRNQSSGARRTNSNFGRLSNKKVANLRGIEKAASFVDFGDEVGKP